MKQKRSVGGTHCGDEESCYENNLPQAKNPAMQDFFSGGREFKKS